MKPDPTSPASVVHRLLFQALLEIRERGRAERDATVFHLADLFHTVVLDMESAARGDQSFEQVLDALSRAAAERGLDRWLGTTLAELTGRAVPARSVA